MKRKKTTAHQQETRFPDGLNDRLVKYNSLSFHLARQNRSTVLTFQEKQQAALIGIARGLQSFKYYRGTSELSWVYLKGSYAVEDAVRNETKRRINKSEKSLSQCLKAEPEVANEYDRIEERETAMERQQQIHALKLAIRKLPERERVIVREIAFHGRRQKEVADKLGITQSWCSRLYNRALTLIKVEICNQYCFPHK